MDGSAGFGGQLTSRLIHTKEQAKLHQFRFGKLGRFMWTSDPGEAWQASQAHLQTRLVARKFDGDGVFVDEYDLGSGNVQSNFVVGLSMDYVGTTNNKAAPLLANLINGGASPYYMYTGTGGTANTYDYQLGTTDNIGSGAITPTYSQIANLTAGTDAQLQLIGTVAYTGTEAVTEWGWFNTNVQGAQKTSNTNTWNAQGQASATWTATLGAAANAFAGYVAVITGTPTGMFILSNGSGTSGTIIGAVTPTTAFYALTSGGGSTSTPSTNTATNIYPLMLDHKTFGAINVVNGDSIQFTYKLRIAAGG